MEKADSRRSVQEAVMVSGITAIWYFEFQKTYQNDGTASDEWVFLCVDRGTMLVRCGESEIRMNEGAAMLLPPGHIHRMRTDSERPSYVLAMRFRVQSPVMKSLMEQRLVLSDGQKDMLRGLIGEIRSVYSLPMQEDDGLQLCADAPLGGRQMVRIQLEALLISLLREHLPVQPEDEDGRDRLIAMRILDLMQSSLHEPVSIEDVSARLGIGKTTLCRAFSRVHGSGIVNFHARLRIDAAKRMLAERGMSVSETAHVLGFGSPQYFSRRFSQVVGVSPRDFIRAAHDEKTT